MDKSSLTQQAMDNLAELYQISKYGDLWKVSCAVERLRKQTQHTEVNDFLWQAECKIDKLRMYLEDTILELQECID